MSEVSLEKRWGEIATELQDSISGELIKALECSKNTGYGFIVIKKDRSGGYRVGHKLWPEIVDSLKAMGAIGGFSSQKK